MVSKRSKEENLFGRRSNAVFTASVGIERENLSEEKKKATSNVRRRGLTL